MRALQILITAVIVSLVGVTTAAATMSKDSRPVLRLTAAGAALDPLDFVLVCQEGRAEIRIETQRLLPMTAQVLLAKTAYHPRQRAVRLTAQREVLGLFRPTVVTSFVNAVMEGRPPMLLLPDGHSFLPGSGASEVRAQVMKSLEPCGWRMANGRLSLDTHAAGLPRTADGRAFGEAEGADSLLVAEDVTWAELRGADGERRFQRLLQAGDHVFLPAEPGLVLIVGNLPAARLFVQGREVELPAERKGLLRALLLDSYRDAADAGVAERGCAEAGKITHAAANPDGEAGERTFERPVYLAGQTLCQVVLSQR